MLRKRGLLPYFSNRINKEETLESTKTNLTSSTCMQKIRVNKPVTADISDCTRCSSGRCIVVLSAVFTCLCRLHWTEIALLNLRRRIHNLRKVTQKRLPVVY